MATQYTSLLGFALPVTGELSGTWGDVVNDSITELVEDAIAGSSTKDITGADWTLTTTGSGSTNEARSAILIATGTPGTARNIVAPSQSKAYIVSNQSDSTVTIKGSATTGVPVAAGTEALVAWDGSDFVNVSVKPAGSNTQVQYNNNGVLGASSALTFDGTTLATTTVDATNLEVTNLKAKDGTAAGSIADSTGVVTLASSVLTTTDINGGTVDNVTIGGATPGLITGTTITANTAVATDTINEKTTAAGVTIDSVLLKDDVVNATDVEVGSISANDGTQAATIANSTGVMTIASSVLTTTDINGGTIDGATIGGSSAAAITGTTITGTSFVSSGDMTFSDNDKAIFGAGSDLQIYHDGTKSVIDEVGTGNLYIKATELVIRSATNEDFIDCTTNGAVRLYHDNSAKLATTSTGIDVTGNVVSDGASLDGAVVINESGADVDFRIESDTNANAFFLDGANGRVGIGTSSPDEKLDVRGTIQVGVDGTTAGLIRFMDSGSVTEEATISSDANGGLIFGGNSGPGELIFKTGSATERMRIDSSGNVGIGTTSPAAILEVSGGSADYNPSATGTGLFHVKGGATSQYSGYIGISDAGMSLGHNGGGSRYLRFDTNETERMRIDSSGNVGIGTSSPNYKLTIQGSDSHLRLRGASNTNKNVSIFYNESGDYGQINCDEAGVNQQDLWITGLNLKFGRNTILERMRIDSSGNVGIGTSSPTTVYGFEKTVKIESVNNSEIALSQTSNSKVWSMGVTNGMNYNQTSSGNGYDWQIGGSSKMRIDSSGNVGIGTSSPDTALNIEKSYTGGSDIGYPHIFLTNTASAGNGATTFNQALLSVKAGTTSGLIRASNDTGGSYGTNFDIWGVSNNPMRFATNNTERMRIDSSGNVGIKQTAPTTRLMLGGGTSIGSDSSLVASFYCGGDENTWTQDRNEVIRIGRSDIKDSFYHSIWSATGSASTETLHWLRFYIQGQSAQTLSLSMYGNGDAQFHHALSKASGSFKIDHPIPEMKDTHHLVHSFVEGPQADLIYRGRVTLTNGLAQVNIDTASNMTDGTFVLLCRDVQCFTSNESGWTAVRGSVDGNILTIEAQDNTCTDTISWLVIGERQDQHMYDTGWTDENGKVIVEPLKSAEEALEA